MSKGPRKGKIIVTGEFFLHRYLWLGAERLQAAESEVLEGSDFPRLGALLFTYFAFEAFLNDLGPRIEPRAWQNEREFFSRGDYRGTIGKLDFLLNALQIPSDKGARPYQTIVELDRRRDALVHPSTEQIHREMPADKATLVVPDAMTLATREFIDRAQEDVARMADDLLVSAHAMHGPHVVPLERAFEGTIGYSNTWLPGSNPESSEPTAT